MYELYDNANGTMQLLIKTNYMAAVKREAQQRCEDTDDECYLILKRDGEIVKDRSW